jgi:putative transposase
MKDEEKRKEKISTFRFGVIADLVTGVVYTRGEKEKILKAKSQRKYEVPYSDRSRVSRETILKWVRDYERGGRCLEALFPKARSDKGTYKSLEPAIRLAVKDLLKETPRITVPAVIRRLRHDKILPVEDELCPATLYRYLKHEKLRKPNEEADDRRQFEAEYPNQIWQSDVMHGPYVTVGKRKRKAYLIAFLDDHSRFILHAEFYLNEQLETFRKALQQAVTKHGLCQKLYVDNGSCFRGIQLEHTAAQLGIGISHSRPYIPQGRGKIERWFLSVRQQFLLGLRLPDNMDLTWLNDRFESWLDSYQRSEHKGIKHLVINTSLI